ncbi:hypothetical protein E4T56_gene9018 [Termitomyces sp. T112]|nr:hypothetical protein E4T56_gene9018 [Termitomyces sp. T112]
MISVEFGRPPHGKPLILWRRYEQNRQRTKGTNQRKSTAQALENFDAGPCVLIYVLYGEQSSSHVILQRLALLGNFAKCR